ncbi:MAG: prepilin-type N-terminal cleavage/methylation domain-containing protein [Planctomycetes bacterium]|nr:prepilin-type N-terminal cleavage/methylation domain-containing protein [Planctomycetota bacterium]
MALKRTKQAFTLVELLVVIALISLLVAVLVPVVITFMSGRGLRMAGNNVQGFFAFSRSEALNSRQPHIIVCYPVATELDVGGPIMRTIGPGFAVFRIDVTNDKTEDAIVFLKEFRLDQLGDDINFPDRWQSEYERTPLTGFGRLDGDINERFGDYYRIVMRQDGRAIIPGDKPGYTIDRDTPEGMVGDIVLQDARRFLFIDVNPATGGVRSSETFLKEETGYDKGGATAPTGGAGALTR